MSFYREIPWELNNVAIIKEERKRQNKKWGLQKHTLRGWLSILKEEVAELECVMTMVDEGYDNMTDVRKEAIQVAAVALSISDVEMVE